MKILKYNLKNEQIFVSLFVLIILGLSILFVVPNLSVSLPISSNQWYSGTVNGQTVSGIYTGSDIYFVPNEKASLDKAAQAMNPSIYGNTMYYGIKAIYKIKVTSPSGISHTYDMGFVNLNVDPGHYAAYSNSVQLPSYSFNSNGPITYLSDSGYPRFKFNVPDYDSSIGQWSISDQVLLYTSDLNGNAISNDITANGPVSFYAFKKPAASVCDASRQEKCQSNSVITCNFGTSVSIEACGSKQCKEISSQSAICTDDASSCSVGQIKCLSPSSYQQCSDKGSGPLWYSNLPVPDGKYCSNNQLYNTPTTCSDGTQVGSCSSSGSKCILQTNNAIEVSDSSCQSNQPSSTPQFCDDGTPVGECKASVICKVINNQATFADDSKCIISPSNNTGSSSNTGSDCINKLSDGRCTDCSLVGLTYDSDKKVCTKSIVPGVTDIQTIEIVGVVLVILLLALFTMGKKKK